MNDPMRKSLFTIMILIIVLISCKHDMVAPGTSSTPVSIVIPPSVSPTTNDTVCFQTEVLPLYQSYCGSSGCHNTGSAKEGVVLTDYFNIMKGIRAKNPSGSKYYTIIGGSMPPRNSPALTSTQTALILKWINQGALNTVCVGGTCDSTKTTYTNGISQIFATNCNGCHGLPPGSGNVLLNNYANAKAAAVSNGANFLNAINYKMANTSQNMPPAAPLGSCQNMQITKWVNSGYPQ